MAERRNYFEIIDTLSFDPVEMKDKKIEDAIELWKSREEKRGISVEDALGVQRQQELAMYEDIKKCLSDRSSRRAEANAMKQEQMKKFKGIIALLKESGECSISEKRVLAIAEKTLRLSHVTVSQAFQEAGFTISVPLKPAEIKLPAPVISKQIDNNIKKLSAMKDRNFPWLSKVCNLYDLAAFYNGEGENAKIYASKPAAELKSIMERGSARFSGQQGELNHCFADLFSLGIENIFKDEESKTKYDNFLKLEKLGELFSLLTEMPEEMKKEAYIAETCIKKIQSCFPVYENALAIYNDKAGLTKEPYEPDSGEVNYICSCGMVNRVKSSDIQDDKGKMECKCKSCNAALFVKCVKCSQFIPAVADTCPQCGFNLVASKFFKRYVELARNAIASMDIAEARKQLVLAKNARPDDSELKSLEKEIDDAARKYEAPLEEIRNLMNQSLYMQANKWLGEFCAKYPGIKMDDIKAQIDKVLADADRRFSQIGSQADPCGACLDILDIVKDYTKASDFIKGRRPKAVADLNASVSAKSGQAVLQWAGTGERNISYRVVRREGASPRNISDGVIVLRDQPVTQYIDTSISAGTVYYYAVFAERFGIYSEPTPSKACFLLQDLDEKRVHRNAEEGKCAFSWQLPQNCRGVRILRSDRGRADVNPGQGTKLIAECAINGYTDGTVENGTTYDYRLQCVYSAETGSVYSEGIVFSMMPDSRPVPVTLVSVRAVSAEAFQVAWDYRHDVRNSIMDLYDIKPGVQVEKGAVYSVEDLVKIGTKVGTVSDISAKSCELRVSQERGYRLCAVVIKGQYAAVGNYISCSTFGKIEIDNARSRIKGNELFIYLKKDLPQDITGIRYTVATKQHDSEPAPWRGIEDVQEMTPLPVSAYKADGAIIVGEVPKKVLYISVVGEYRVGEDIYYSEPSKLRLSNMPKPVISYKIAWGLLGRKKNVKLIIECDTDTDLPEMQLCCSSRAGLIPTSAMSADVIQLCEIPEDVSYTARTRREIEIPNDTWIRAVRGNEMRLLLPNDQSTEFRMAPDTVSLVIP